MILKHMSAFRSAAALVVMSATVVALALIAGPAVAQSTGPTFESAPCMFEGVDLGLTNLGGSQLGFECGYVTVPVRHENPEGPTLRLPVAIHRATGPNIKPDPLFLAQGGPGGDAFGVFSILTPFTPMAVERDLVIFNQRGTQYSEPDLSCPEVFDALPDMLAADSESAEQLGNDALQLCYQRLVDGGIDLSAFNSLQNAADVEAVRQALGYDEYNFYGVSYGTLLGLHLMNRNPEGLRSVILDSVAPTDINFVSEIARSENRIYDALFAACDAEAACREEYPDLEGRYFALIDRLNGSPVTLSIENPDTGESYDALVDGTALRSIVYQLLYLPRMHAVFPKLVADMEVGDYRYVEAMWPIFAFDQSISEGMYFSVMCAEDADINADSVSFDGVRTALAESASDDLQAFLNSCALWPVTELPSSVDDPVYSDIPTLLLSGAFDPITPSYFAEAAASNLSHAYNLVDPTASHGVAFQSLCINSIVQAFLDDPATAPDSNCLAEQALPRAIPPDAITLPLLAGVNSLDTGLLAEAGVGGILLIIVLSAFAIWPLVFVIRAIRDQQPAYDSASKRLRWASRILMLAFGLVAFVFAVGMVGFVFSSLIDLTYVTGLALPASAAPVLWLPLVMLMLGIGVLVSAVLLWRHAGTGSAAGKIYYSILTMCAIGILALLGIQGLLLPPL